MGLTDFLTKDILENRGNGYYMKLGWELYLEKQTPLDCFMANWKTIRLTFNGFYRIEFRTQMLYRLELS